MVNKKHLFIAGCPRSGTTALWKILSTHSKLAIGVERYIGKVLNSYELTEEYFSKERFFSWQSGDSHFQTKDASGQRNFYIDLVQRYDNCEFYGDKIPQLSIRFDQFFLAFPDAYVIFIYRNIFDVASSYVNRFHDTSDGWKRNFDNAIKEWNRNLVKTLEYKKKGKRIYCISYEELFFSEDNLLYTAFDTLGLDIEPSVKNTLAKAKDQAQLLEENRKCLLSSEQKQLILLNAGFGAYRKIHNIRNQF